MWTLVRTQNEDFSYAVIKKGHRTGVHTHPDANHYTCIMDGKAIAWLDGEMVELGAGDVLSIPIGVPHDVGGTEDLYCVDLNTPIFDPGKMEFMPEREEEIGAQFHTMPGWTEAVETAEAAE